MQLYEKHFFKLSISKNKMQKMFQNRLGKNVDQYCSVEGHLKKTIKKTNVVKMLKVQNA